MTSTEYDLDAKNPSARYTMSLFTVEEFQRFWPDIEAMLDRVPHTWRQWTKEFIWERVTTDRIQVWGIGPPSKITMVFMTTVVVFPTMRVLSVEWGAGTFEDDMLSLIKATLVNYAQLNGCEEIECKGRLGWEPKWKSIGAKRKYSVWTLSVPRDHLN